MKLSTDQINTMFEISKIIITAVLTASLTYWINSKKESAEKKYKINKELIDKVYEPIIKIINQSVIPGDGYEGLGNSEIDYIINIIDKNARIVEPKLESFSWRFKEEIHYNGYSDRNVMYDIYDDDRKFLDYINYRYNIIRKKIYLPYNGDYFFIQRKYRQFILWKDKLLRKVYRRLRSIRKKQ